MLHHEQQPQGRHHEGGAAPTTTVMGDGVVIGATAAIGRRVPSRLGSCAIPQPKEDRRRSSRAETRQHPRVQPPQRQERDESASGGRAGINGTRSWSGEISAVLRMAPRLVRGFDGTGNGGNPVQEEDTCTTRSSSEPLRPAPGERRRSPSH
ncbi:hypothetical protein GCM10023215_39750 [Pseudonocardia yuanmonensis]|uniref:Uncharacterized protein n=1 Tax=Pseudonocardia yuanmonensis TaxID=1095914 RepID=A0ABP8X026_9PSEU